MTLPLIFAFMALVCFVFAGLPGLVVVSKINLGWLGMAFFTIAWLCAGVLGK